MEICARSRTGRAVRLPFLIRVLDRPRYSTVAHGARLAVSVPAPSLGDHARAVLLLLAGGRGGGGGRTLPCHTGIRDVPTHLHPHTNVSRINQRNTASLVRCIDRPLLPKKRVGDGLLGERA